MSRTVDTLRTSVFGKIDNNTHRLILKPQEAFRFFQEKFAVM